MAGARQLLPPAHTPESQEASKRCYLYPASSLSDSLLAGSRQAVCARLAQRPAAPRDCHCRYESLSPSLLPERLWLIWCDNPSDSGAVHANVKQRWLAGDPDVVHGMKQVGS
jgi:hypothetical protein